MALFKILKGKASGLSAKPAVEGYCYFTTDDGKFYIDIASASTATIGSNRICLNAAKADLASKADKLTTARTIALSGSVTGSASFDGTGNITIKTTTNHTHSYLPTAGGTMGGTAMISWPDTGNWGNSNSGVTFPVKRGGLSWAGQSDGVQLYAVETANDNLDLYLAFSDDNSNGLSIRNAAGNQTARINADGTFVGSFSGNLSGNASTATKLATARTVALSGSVTGFASFDGSGNITIATTTNHTHNYAGSSSAGGSANSAVKLQTARKIGSASFDGSADITLAQIGAQAAGNYMRGTNANGYWGLARPNDGNTADYIRTTSAGFIPYQSGSLGGGHCYIGTSSWYFGNSYIDNSYVNKVHFNNGSANISYDATNKSINFNFT